MLLTMQFVLFVLASAIGSFIGTQIGIRTGLWSLKKWPMNKVRIEQ